MVSVKMYLLVWVGDYIDFYSSIEYVINVGKMFCDLENVFLFNWKYIFVGYYGWVSLIIFLGVLICWL